MLSSATIPQLVTSASLFRNASAFSKGRLQLNSIISTKMEIIKENR